MNPKDIDIAPFPNVGNNPFYNKEFSIGNMLPQIGLTDNDVICRGVRPYANDPKYSFELLDELNLETIQESSGDTKKYPVYIMLMHSGTALANAIKGMTHSEFSHSSISFDETMTTMYSFGRKADMNPFIGGFKEENINSDFFKSKDIPYALYMIPCTTDQIRLMKQRLDYFVKNQSKFRYDFTGLFKNYLGIVDNPEYKWFCSRFVADIINSGYPSSQPIKNPNLVKPEDFKNMEFATYVTGGNLKDYNPAKVKQLANKIISSKVTTESAKKRVNDKGEEVPEVCSKCGSKIGVYLKGEPLYLCTNKDCAKYFGTLPCNITESTKSGGLVFLSKDSDLDENMISPRIPDNFLTRNGFEDNITPRVCVSTSVSKALRALSQNLLFEEFYVYTMDDGYKIHTPTIKQVPDVLITDEKWILEPVALYKVGKIKVTGNVRGVGYSYKYGNNQTAKLYDWAWIWLEKDGEDPCSGKPLIVQENTSEEEPITENWIMIEDDFEVNIDEWKPGNPLWITGASGDGKSTLTKKLSEEYNSEIVTSDIVLLRLGSNPTNFMTKLNNAKSVHNMSVLNSPAMDYVKSHPNLPWGARNPVTKEWNNDIIKPEMLKFYMWFMSEAEKNPRYKNRLFIVEGCDICLMDPNIMITKPLIVVGGSRLRSMWRRAKRDSMEKDRSILQSVFKYIRNYNIQNRSLDDQKEMFRDSLETIMSESVKRSELPDSVFGIPQERKYPMPDEKHTRSAMKLFNHCEKKYEEQLAKHIIKNIRKYNIDPSFVGPKNRLRKYLIRANLITEGVNEMEDTNPILDQMFFEFFGECNPKSDADILFEKYFGEASKSEDIQCVPDKIEPMVKKLENKKYRVKYASPGHSNTTFDNDKNKDGVINGKLVSTGRIIFERDYHFDGTPEGWQWKKLENGFRALYVKPFTYTGSDGHEKEAFNKWQSDYLENLDKWIESLPMMDSENPRNKPEEDEK